LCLDEFRGFDVLGVTVVWCSLILFCGLWFFGVRFMLFRCYVVVWVGLLVLWFMDGLWVLLVCAFVFGGFEFWLCDFGCVYCLRGTLSSCRLYFCLC